MCHLATGRSAVDPSRERDVAPEELLSREVLELDTMAAGQHLSGKRVLITGAGGSIGAELCRRVTELGPSQLVLFEQAENALFTVHEELRRERPAVPVVPFIGDICDARRVEHVFRVARPQVVYHAAAHKHVPMMEANPGEAIKNNVFGTRLIADAADRHGAEGFVFVSTDKAVNPTSVMGLSKRMAEIYVQALSAKSGTRFVVVRFGNVLGSAGSVVATFSEQIRKGGPVTVTHPLMARYFVTVGEASRFIMLAGAVGRGGEVLILDMGEPVRIVDLAREMIRRSGLSEVDVPIAFTAVRPGEKLFEEMSLESEALTPTGHAGIFVVAVSAHPLEEVHATLEVLARMLEGATSAQVRDALRSLIPEQPDRDDPSSPWTWPSEAARVAAG